MPDLFDETAIFSAGFCLALISGMGMAAGAAIAAGGGTSPEVLNLNLTEICPNAPLAHQNVGVNSYGFSVAANSDRGPAYVIWNSDPVSDPLGMRTKLVEVGTSGTCSFARRVSNSQVNEVRHGGGATDHDDPSVVIDGRGFLHAFYFGREIALPDDVHSVPSPYYRRSAFPAFLFTKLPHAFWNTERSLRVHDRSEIIDVAHLSDGSIVVSHSGNNGLIDVYDIFGGFRDDAPLQPVTQDDSLEGSNCADNSHDYEYTSNRFTKMRIAVGPGPRGGERLHIIWGWSGVSERDNGTCPDSFHYSEDSHAVYYAFSDDGGESWNNWSGEKSVGAASCSTIGHCRNWQYATTYLPEDARGIKSNDGDFRITDLRQTDRRDITVAPDGTVVIAFQVSKTCVSGICGSAFTPSTPLAPPGVAMLLRLEPDGDVYRQPGAPVMIDDDPKTDDDPPQLVLRVRQIDRNTVYVWTLRETDRNVLEWVSHDGGETWEAPTTVFLRLDGTRIGQAIQRASVTADEHLCSVLIAATINENDGTIPNNLLFYRKELGGLCGTPFDGSMDIRFPRSPLIWPGR